MTVENNKALVRRFFAAIESGDFNVFDEIVAPDYDDHLTGGSRGREARKRSLAGLHEGQLAEHWEVADFATLMQQLDA